MVGVVVTATGIIVALFTVIGPIGTYVTFTPLQRFAYCASVAVLATPVYYAMMVVTLYYLRYRAPFLTAVAVAAVLLIGAIPVTSVAYSVHLLFFPANTVPDPWASYVTAAGVAISCSILFNYVIFQRISRTEGAAVRPVGDAAAAGDPVAAFDASQPRRRAAGTPPASVDGRLSPQATPSTEAATPEPTLLAKEDAEQRTPFLKRLPRTARGEIIFLKTENHYVQVYTTAGSSRLLLRFTDAIAELGDLGMQVHRSYWVARENVLEVVKRDNRTLLRLTGDHEVPVSRTHVPAVKAILLN